jgi:hypothetical protein
MLQQTIYDSLLAGAGGLSVGVLTLSLMPLIERLFSVTTGMTLIELRDPKEPLFAFGRCLAHFAADPDLVYVTCHLRGAAKLRAKVEELTGLKDGETDTESRFTYQTGACLGSCSSGPELIVDGRHYGRMTPEKIEDVLKHYE